MEVRSWRQIPKLRPMNGCQTEENDATKRKRSTRSCSEPRIGRLRRRIEELENTRNGNEEADSEVE